MYRKLNEAIIQKKTFSFFFFKHFDKTSIVKNEKITVKKFNLKKEIPNILPNPAIM
jgi:hypothetical protein